MQDFVKRMIKEQKDLAEKIEKLQTFLINHGNELPPLKKSLMYAQLYSMDCYEEILNQRIELEKKEEKETK